MTITTAMCTSFKRELLLGEHNFSSGGSAFYLALFDSTATLGVETTTYSSVNEAVGPGYIAGGKVLTNVTPSTGGSVAFTDFGDVSWTASTFTTRGAMIYNQSNGNAAVSVHDFGVDVSVISGTLTVQFPNATASEAILRLA
jgi:hypothetical protein